MTTQRLVMERCLSLLVLLAFFSACANAGGMGSGNWIALGSTCTIGSMIDKPCAPGLICLLDTAGRPEVDIPHVGVCNFPTVPRCYRAATNTSWGPGTSFPVDSCNTCFCSKTGGKLICTSTPVVQCTKDPCQTAKCPAYPNAKCVSNYCGGCNAVFYVNGKVVDCKKIQKPPPPPPPKGVAVNGACTIGSLLEKKCAPGLVCVLEQQGRPEVDIPNVGICKPQSADKCQDPETRMFWAFGVTVKKPNCTQCVCGKRILRSSPPMIRFDFDCSKPPACPAVISFPCEGKTCPGYPTAKCRPDPCAKCLPEWYIGNQLVTCKKPPPPPPPKGVALNGVCTIGSLLEKKCAPGLVCVLEQQGRPEVDIPNVGICKPQRADKCEDPETRMLWAFGVTVKKPNCTQCVCGKIILRSRPPIIRFGFSCSEAPACPAVISFPCDGKTCPGYPSAKCRPDPCANCLPEWYIGDQLVTCNPPAPRRLGLPLTVPLNGKCLVGTRGARQCAKGLICLLTKYGKPEVDVPNEGTCKPSKVPKCQDPTTQEYWAPGTSYKKPNCINCNCFANPTTKKPVYSCVRAPMCSFTPGFTPCDNKTCPGFPTAKCRLDSCSSCYAEWYIGNEIVECRPPPPPTTIPLNGKCFVGTRGAKPCNKGLICLLTKKGKPEVDIPNEGTCKPSTEPKCQDPTTQEYWAPGTSYKKPNCINCNCFVNPTTKKAEFSCMRAPMCALAPGFDPCADQTCYGYPNAKCRLEPCSACSAEWYIGDQVVECKPEPPIIPENGSCIVGGRNVKPCAPGLTCWLTTGGFPWFDAPNRGTCKNLKKVKSCYEKTTNYYWAPKSVHDTLPCGKCTCPANGGSLTCTEVLAQCFANPCLVSKCPKYPKAECRANYCGGCKADYYVNGTKVECF